MSEYSENRNNGGGAGMAESFMDFRSNNVGGSFDASNDNANNSNWSSNLPRSSTLPSAPAPPVNYAASQATVESLKHWSLSTYKQTRQAVTEKLGKATRTVDVELEQQITNLRLLQQQYDELLRLARALAVQFRNLMQTQKQLSNCFIEMGHKETDLDEEFRRNAEMQRSVCKNGEALMAALNFFINTVNTLCHKTIEDTLLTVKVYESARLEYDAYRTDLEELQKTTNNRTAADYSARLHEAQTTVDVHRLRYEQLRDDIMVKIRFLGENKSKVMKNQLLLFHNAIANFFCGNQQGLEAALKQFSIKVPTSDGKLSWLEQ